MPPPGTRAPRRDRPAQTTRAPRPETSPLRVLDPLCAVFRRRLRGEGLKYTPERAGLLDVVMRLEGVFEADRVLDEARKGGGRVSKATVYRTLRLLLEAGIIQRVPIDDEQAHYHVVYGQNPGALIIRLDTREALAVEIPNLADLCARACESRGLKPRGHRLQIFAGG